LSKIRLLFNRTNLIALLILIISFLAYWQLSHRGQINPFNPEGLIETVEEAGIWAIIIYIGVLAIAVVLSPIPGNTLTITAGAMWGAIPGSIYSIIGGFFGASMAYFIGKTLGRSAVKFITGKMIYFSEDKGKFYIAGVILLTRLLPFFSFDLISYGAGIAGISFPVFIIATLLGMIPSTLILTYLGESLTIDIHLTIIISIILSLVLIALPFIAKHYKWFDLKNIIHIE
jgi:uncharacterized membrane protein YdjX (TVP38/TMEM64 family)